MLLTNATPMLGVIVTGVTQEQLDWPGFNQVLTNWKQVARRVVVVTPAAAGGTRMQKVRYVTAAGKKVTAAEVIQAGVAASEGVQGSIAVVDPLTVLRFAIFDIYAIAAKRQLGTAWMATGLAQKLEDYMTGGPLEPDGLRLFITSENVWNYVLRSIDKTLPFITPLWSGNIATWAGASLHTHKYHDVTALDAIGVVPGPEHQATPEELSHYGIKATFNPPMKSFVQPK